MKTAKDVITSSLEKGVPLSAFACRKLRKAEKEDALKVNAHNIVNLMLAGKAVSASELSEAERYFPEQAEEWKQAGGKVKAGKGEAEWVTINAAAGRMGIYQSTLDRTVKRNADAPKPRDDGKYLYSALVEFYALHQKYSAKSPADTKVQILEQELRLKRIKADQQEGLLIEKAVVVDILNEADTVLEQVIREVIEKYVPKSDREEETRNAKGSFAVWRKFIESLA